MVAAKFIGQKAKNNNKKKTTLREEFLFPIYTAVYSQLEKQI